MLPAPHPFTHYALRFTFALLLLSLPCPAQHSTNAAAEAKLKQLQVAPGLKVELVAAEPLLQNPVAFSVDERGRFFIAETHRWKKAVFDITQRVPWLLDDLSCRTVADREAHLRRLFTGTNFAVLTNDSEVIRLVEDTDGDGRADKSTVIADGFNAPTAGPAAGILARKGEVWFACLPDLWRISTGELRRSNAPSSAVGTTSPIPHSTFAVRNLASGLGVHISVSGHDLHGLVFGPDGRLYFSLGDRGFELRPGMKHPGFSAEYLRRIAPDTGAVFRCQPDGSELEVFCIGLRNPQGLAFDALGNLFTVDNDTAGPDKARLLHLVEGGDYGWRISYQHMKHFGPWVTEELWRGGTGDILPWSGEVAQGPAGLAFYPGTGLPDRYTNHFFICDFPGGIWSFSLKPRGASFELAAREKFLWNLLPTHAAFGPDGALYVSDWVEGWGQPEKGRLYRVSDPAADASAAVKETKRLLSANWSKMSIDTLGPLLGHQDQRVRALAQAEFSSTRFEPTRVPVGSTMKKLFDWTPLSSPASTNLVMLLNTDRSKWLAWMLAQETNQLGRIHALWTKASLTQTSPTSELFGLGFHIKAADPVIRAQMARAFASAKSDASMMHLLELMRDSDPRVQFHAVQSYGREVVRRGYAGTFSPLVPIAQLLERNGETDPTVHQACVTAMVRFSNAEHILAHVGRSKHAAVRLGACLALRRLNDPAIAQFLRDPDPRLVLEAARAINDAGIEPAYPALAALLPSGRDALLRVLPAALDAQGRPAGRPYQDSMLLRALNAHYRLGHATNAQALAEFATSANASEAPRAESLFLLSAWEIQPATPGNVPVKIARVDGHGSTPLVNPENWPGWFDRVCGLWRPLPPRAATAARDALRPHLPSLLRTTGTNTLLSAIAAVEKLTLTEAAPQLAALLKDTTQPAPVRVASLRTLGNPAIANRQSPMLSASVTLALSDADTSVRREAVKLAAAGNPITAVPLLERILTTEKDSRLRQAALTALGDLPGPAADAVLAQQLTLLSDKKLSPELQLELLEAAAKRPALAAKVGQASSLSSNVPVPAPAVGPTAKEADGKSGKMPDLLHAFRPALFGGDAAEGKRVFNEHAGVQCLRCHAVRGNGGIVGPDLVGVGKRLTREQLLESIVFPNKAIATGFENATIVLKGGANHSGLVKSETATELVLDSPEDGKLTLKKSDIEKRLRGLSAMPEGMDKLMTRRELRDLVEYLSGLK